MNNNMNSDWSFYDLETGLFTGATFSGPRHAIASHTPEGHVALEGLFDHLSKRVDLATSEVVDYQPPQPSADHEWNASSQRWQLGRAAQERQTRRDVAQRKIAALETSQHRQVRELALDQTNVEARKRLKAIEDQIVVLRKELA